MAVIDGTAVLSNAIEATTSKGLLSLGPGPWDATSVGKFSGSGSGTLLAGNLQAAYAGNLIDIQVGGVSKFKVDASGNVSAAGTQTTTGSPTFTGLVTASAGESVTGGFTYTADAAPTAAASGTNATAAFAVAGGVGGGATGASGTAGVGGGGSFTGGAGGSATGLTAPTGGAGGAWAWTAGAGGAVTGVAGTTNTGGAGGAVAMTAGAGGAASGGTTNVGGAGGAASLVAGVGGNGTQTGGAGGAVAITAGNSGTGGNVAGGSVTVTVGTATGTGNSGLINLAGALKSTLTGLPTTGTLVTHLTSATVAAGSNDTAGTITLVVDATGVAQNATLFVLSFAGKYAAAPKYVHIANTTPGADSTALFSGTYAPITIGAAAFSVVNLGHALTASGTFTLAYLVVF